jgi:uncharacterized membrane-anchored protein YhcB (DUF1043 family)
MGASEIVSLATAIAIVVAGVLGYFKWRPGQREQVGMTVAQATMHVAQGTIQLVTTELEDQFKRMSAEMRTMRDEHDQYRRDTDSRLAELGTQLRAEKAEKELVKQENVHLRERVNVLEAQVRELKGDPRP